MCGGPNTLHQWEEYASKREKRERDVVPAVSMLEMQLMVDGCTNVSQKKH